nr:hydantoinase B/oxoprolinase family protein [Sphingomonadaceae bacterium]
VPGPACYRHGGPPTITDCNVALGKVQPEFFPKVFGPGGDASLDRAAAEARLAEVALQAGLSAEAAAEGFVAIAVSDMANAIKAISVARGHDARRFTLACFGGAGGQHACLVADALGMNRVMIHPLAGVLSAYGMGLADRSVVRERTVGLALDDPGIGAARGALEAEAEAALNAQDVGEAYIRVETQAHLRYVGTDSTIDVPVSDAGAMAAAFETRHRARFGFAGSGAIVVDMLRAEAIAAAGDPVSVTTLPARSNPPIAMVETFMAGKRRPTPVFDRPRLAEGFTVAGPALIAEAVATTVVEPGWRATVDRLGNLILERCGARAKASDGTAADPVRLEIFAGRFMAIAEEMGAALRHSAASVNIRERLDFSCALFDAEGSLIANAPHIPVHLGSMGESVRTILARRGGTMRPGDAYALNAPYDGGTHLPDITVIMPVFVADGEATPAFFVAARGHHADIGGISPGSMPPGSTSIEEEGVVFDDVLLVAQGRLCEAEVRALLGAGRWPARNPDQNIADLSAQVAACARGAAELKRLCAETGRETVTAYMRHVQDNAEAAVRRLIARLNDGRFESELDNGAVIRVAASVENGALTVDFTGTSAQLPGNFNAPLSVVRAAVLYVVRCLVDEPIPLNEGCLRPVTIVVPEGSMLNPHYPAAVVAGNVETSQAITDALFGALGAMASAQGTMNNFTFGNAAHQYYETIAGGSGAGPGFPGAPAVQTHMTNSRITDPEILETRFPVIVEEFSIRRGSGGAGEWRGGDGAVRRIRFREPMHAGILSNRRRVPPFGLAGGSDGAPGVNRVERADGRVEALSATAEVEMAADDVFAIETPGGGGFGSAS